MDKILPRRKRWLIVPIALALGIAVWQISIALADAPAPNPLGPSSNPLFAPVPGVDITANGPAASIHGNPTAGEAVFVQTCQVCHGVLGTGGVLNPGSDDGTVPPVNPIDPGFLDDSQGDPAIFARELDVFLQHGSRPAGDNPEKSMPAWGDHKLLSQQQIADVEAYVMELNGVYWPDRWAPPAEVQMTVTRSGDDVKYEINIVNNGVGLGNLDLNVPLPGVTYLSSYVSGPGSNPGKFNGQTVEWINTDGVPAGGSVGPFVILAEATGATVPPTSASLSFQWTTWDGVLLASTSASAPVTPNAPATPTPATPTPAAPAPAAPTPATPAPATPTAVPTPAAPVGDAQAGAAAILKYGCGACHTIPGIQGANGAIGPDLSDFSDSPDIANVVSNTPANLASWIENPSALKAGTTMPSLGVSATDAQNIAAYLESLK